MIAGDLAPTFSSLYPEILADAGLEETAFRQVVERVNNSLIKASRPWGVRNWVDTALGLATGWVWDDVGATGYKSALIGVEEMLREWNDRAAKEGVMARWVPLRRTGYASLDVQIPTPRIGVVKEDEGTSRGGSAAPSANEV